MEIFVINLENVPIWDRNFSMDNLFDKWANFEKFVGWLDTKKWKYEQESVIPRICTVKART